VRARGGSARTASHKSIACSAGKASPSWSELVGATRRSSRSSSAVRRARRPREVERDAVGPPGRRIHARDAVPRRERAGERFGGDVLCGGEVTRDDRHRREATAVLGAVPRGERGRRRPLSPLRLPPPRSRASGPRPLLALAHRLRSSPRQSHEVTRPLVAGRHSSRRGAARGVSGPSRPLWWRRRSCRRGGRGPGRSGSARALNRPRPPVIERRSMA